MSAEVPLLTYHSIDGGGSPLSVAPDAFDQHLAYLRDEGFVPLRLSEAVRCIREAQELPERGVVLTFDDGYLDNLTQALPIMKRHGFTATIFVSTGCTGGKWSRPPTPELAMLDWNQMQELRAEGMDIGAHTQSHPHLTALTPDDAREEMLGSRKKLEDGLGEEIRLFSYPFGSTSDRIRTIASEIFDAAVGNRPGRLRRDSDLYALDRINAGSGLFRRLPLSISGMASFGVYLALKRAIDRVRPPAPAPTPS